MNQADLDYFHQVLSQMLVEAQQKGDSTLEELTDSNEMFADPADRATVESDRAFTLRIRDRERKLLKKVEAAIRRIDEGDYGYCEETGEPIGVARLMARPTATLSLEAQQRRELKQKMYGD